jgi:D-glycero-D-manno-heptose 1,7-bisphosphate phosphatase
MGRGVGAGRQLSRAHSSDDVMIDQTWTVFLDRDGVINRHIVGDYVRSWDEFEFLPGALEGVTVLGRNAGPIVVVTNQAGVGKGLMSESDLAHIHREMVRQVEDAGGRIDAVLYCPHRVDEGCRCRKPAPGMAEAARHQFPAIDLTRSVMVGDSPLDLEFGERLGMETVLVGERSLLEAAYLLTGS